VKVEVKASGAFYEEVEGRWRQLVGHRFRSIRGK